MSVLKRQGFLGKAFAFVRSSAEFSQPFHGIPREEVCGMIDYTGVKCPVCLKEFVPEDDVVVCPDCGTPHHRECYGQTGHCANQEKHKDGYVWKKPVFGQKGFEKEEKTGEKVCPVCRTVNPQNALFCDRCGQPFVFGANGDNPYKNRNSYQDGNPHQNGEPYKNGNPYPGGMPYMGPMPGMGGMPFYDPMGGVNPTDAIGGVPAGDIAKLVQGNNIYYLPVFSKLDRTGSGRFNFCAFLFSGGWLLYRKQYKKGIVIGILVALMYLASFCINMLYTTPMLEEMIKLSGVDFNTPFITMAQIDAIMSQLLLLPGEKIFLVILPTLLGAAQLAVMIVCGIKGNKWYLSHCVSKVQEIREEAPEGTSYGERLKSEGGCNVPIAISLLICYLIVSYLPLFL